MIISSGVMVGTLMSEFDWQANNSWEPVVLILRSDLNFNNLKKIIIFAYIKTFCLKLYDIFCTFAFFLLSIDFNYK